MPSPLPVSSLADCLAGLTAATFLLLAVWHFGMALFPASASTESAAVPSVNGKPLFVPSRTSTVAIGLALVLCGLLVLGTARLVPSAIPAYLVNGASYALALGLLARAVGDFKYVGFFKSVRGTPFATRDTRLYAPLCALLAASVAANAALHSS